MPKRWAVGRWRGRGIKGERAGYRGREGGVEKPRVKDREGEREG